MLDATMSLLFLGTSSCVPNLNDDTSSMVVNGEYLVDTGWNVIENLRKNHIEPTQISHLLFTHLHHDHYLSLTSFLFYQLCKKGSLDHIHIAGPQEDLERVVMLACAYLQIERFYPHAGLPTLIPLKDGMSIHCPGIEIDVCGTLHAVPSLCYRFTDTNTSRVLSISGDTAYSPRLIEHVRQSDLLVHEASLGPVRADEQQNLCYLHSGAEDAGLAAARAQVKQLVLIHGDTDYRAESIQAAAKHYSGSISWPKPGETYNI